MAGSETKDRRLAGSAVKEHFALLIRSCMLDCNTTIHGWVIRRDAMEQQDIQAYRAGVRAAHRYEVVESLKQLTLAGKRYHFIGAGGVGMSGLARLLISNECIVSGSDQLDSNVTEALRGHGASITIGHSPENVDPQTYAVVVSAAITDDNPELRRAVEQGCKVYKYAQMLGELMDRYEGIAISGTHGKSTTSGWLTHLMRQSGVDVNFIVGAELCQLGGSSGAGKSGYFVAEACEYDRSFLNLRPRIGCILNIEQDHLDYYADENEIVEAFTEFALGVRPSGAVVGCGDDENVARVFEMIPRHVRRETFGLGDDCNFRADNLKLVDGHWQFDVLHDGRLLGPARIGLPGDHNIMNGLAVIAMATLAGMEPESILENLDGFTGVDRRLMLKGRRGDTVVLDDYAHHPTEIRASLAAIRQKYEPRRLWCIFQPHQYSRTRFLLDDFAESFKLADVTIVPEIYFVRDSEASRREINSQILVDRVRASGSEALFIDGFEEICEHLKEHVADGDLVVTMGAGDIWKVADEYIQWLGSDC